MRHPAEGAIGHARAGAPARVGVAMRVSNESWFFAARRTRFVIAHTT
jgi:hypothetical protein